MLAIKQPLPPSNFMRKGRGGPIISGFMQKYPGIIRGVTLQPTPTPQPTQRKNTLERM